MEDDDELTQEIEAQVNEWSSNSNDCVYISLRRDDGSVVADFQPDFTYAMFGQEEAIFGYQNLKINLCFRASDMSPKLTIEYDSAFEPQGDVRPTDIEEALQEFLPPAAFDDTQAAEHAQFRPPGDLIHKYQRGSKSYEVYHASLTDPLARDIMQNMQVLIPMFIDGGSTLELDHDWTTARWSIFFVYEVDGTTSASAPSYTLAGFGTSYRTFTFPERQKVVQFDVFSPTSKSLEDFLPPPGGSTNELSQSADFASPLELPSRERLSQFLMFPPWHGAGHGQELYGIMYKHLTSSPNVREFTVEDPNEKFDDLRDLCDLLYLRANVPEFASLRVNTDIPAEKLALDENVPVNLIVPEAVRKHIMRDTKIMPRQFDRLVEMHTLSFIPHQHRSRNRLSKKHRATDPNDRAYYFWRLYVKQRLYMFNRDQLGQVEHQERVDKLNGALDSVLEQYTQTLERLEKIEQEKPVTAAAGKRKRRVVDDDEDDEDVDDVGKENEVAARDQEGQKKLKVG